MSPCQPPMIARAVRASKRATGSSSLGEDLEGASTSSCARAGIAVAPERSLAERGERERLDDRLVELARLLANLLHLDLDRREVLEPPRSARRDVPRAERRSQLECAQAERPRVRVRLARDRALGRLDQRCRGLLRELLGRRTLELGQELDRLVEVVRADLDELLARALREPLGEARVVLRPRELRHARVGDLADERVLEPVGGLARDRRARLAQEELALEQVVEQRLVLGDVGRRGARARLARRPARRPIRAGGASSRPDRDGRCARRSAPAACPGRDRPSRCPSRSR